MHDTRDVDPIKRRCLPNTSLKKLAEIKTLYYINNKQVFHATSTKYLFSKNYNSNHFKFKI